MRNFKNTSFFIHLQTAASTKEKEQASGTPKCIFLRVKFRIIYCVKNIAQTICTNKVASFSFTEDWICYAHHNFILLFLCGMSIVQRIFPAILLNLNLLKTASHKTVKGVKVWLSHRKSFFASTLKILYLLTQSKVIFIIYSLNKLINLELINSYRTVPSERYDWKYVSYAPGFKSLHCFFFFRQVHDLGLLSS